MNSSKEKKIVFYSLINGVGNTTIAYQLSRLLRLPLYQDQKNDLVFFLKNKLNSSRYVVKQLDELNATDYKEGAVYDLKEANKKIFEFATDIMVLTNNSYIDILKTIATLQKIQSLVYDKNKPIHVVFNRLQNGNASREKKYTKVSKEMILANVKDMNIKFSYIRSNLIYYTEVSEGRFFMESFFNKNYELLEKYPTIQDMEYTEYLEMFYDYQYEDAPYDFQLYECYYEDLYKDRVEAAYDYNRHHGNKKRRKKTTPDGINEEIAKLNFHQENIRLSRASIRDMYSLLYKMGIYNKEMYECFSCENGYSCWKRTARENRTTNKLSASESKCKKIRTYIEEN
ncbi:hypothetical protein [Sulfurimonas sp.]|uniref:hypothetical protein n=1 Tax=Sulfurimonas sp. TaxID=2022749 RepID=UPI003D0C4916